MHKKYYYFIAELEVRDQGIFKSYISEVHKIVHSYGGEYLVRGGPIIASEGNWSPQRIIVIRFKTAEDAKKCFESSEYKAILPYRLKSSEGKWIIVEGVEDQG